MNSRELLQKIIFKINRFKFLIVITGILLAGLAYFYAKSILPIYSTEATVFPLTGNNNSSSANNALSSILGGAEAAQSFSQEASINIIELALSRTTREAVALERIDSLGNKTIAELLIFNHNKSKGYFQPEIPMPVDDRSLASVGGSLLKTSLLAKINKNGILIISFSSTNPVIVSPVSYVFIDKISAFYKDLKIRKAQFDYNFTTRKLDSLQRVLNTYDRRAIRMNNTTLFTPPDKIQYTIPKENLANDKEIVMAHREASANNREEALWRLQKVTPIIAILDRPDPPFLVKAPSGMFYAMIGFMIGCFAAIILCISGILYKFGKMHANQALYRQPVIDNTVSTTI